MTENDNKQPHTVGRQLASGVFYTSIAKYAGIVVTLVVSGVLARLFTPEEFGVVNIATVVIAFFAIFSDLGIGPAEGEGSTFTFTIAKEQPRSETVEDTSGGIARP